MRRFFFACVISVLGLSACNYQVSLHEYRPIVRGAEDPNVAVSLRVEDSRPPDQGGVDPSLIGTVRGRFGEPYPLHASEGRLIEQLVRSATVDGLRLARAAVVADSPRALVAAVKSFWIDGYMANVAVVEVELSLYDDHLQLLWRTTVRGSSGGVGVFDFAGMVIPGTIDRALNAYAMQLSAEVGQPAVQKHLF